jgi:hypothetical protein
MKKLHPRMVRQHLPQFTLLLFFSAARSRCRHAVRLQFSEALHHARSPYADARAVQGVWIANVL